MTEDGFELKALLHPFHSSITSLLKPLSMTEDGFKLKALLHPFHSSITKFVEAGVEVAPPNHGCGGPSDRALRRASAR